MESLNASEVRGPRIYYKTADNHTDYLHPQAFLLPY